MLVNCMGNKHGASKTEAVDAKTTTCSGLHMFSRKEIKKAMDSWKYTKVRVASGAGSGVYLGILPNGQLVVIKKLKGKRTVLFHTVVDIHCRVCHPNIVSLVGTCRSDDSRKSYLVYEYCSNGNLAQQLTGGDYVLSWEERVKILRGVALALRFLHGHPDGSIVHSGIKAKNILLTENMDPKLSNFGSTKVLGLQESAAVAGKTGRGVDVHGFGVVALQVLSGSAAAASDDAIVEKAREAVGGRRGLVEIKDARLTIGQDDVRDMEYILRIAVLCVSEAQEGRPTMEVVFEVVDEVWRKIRGSHLEALERSQCARYRSLERRVSVAEDRADTTDLNS